MKMKTLITWITQLQCDITSETLYFASGHKLKSTFTDRMVMIARPGESQLEYHNKAFYPLYMNLSLVFLQARPVIILYELE